MPDLSAGQRDTERQRQTYRVVFVDHVARLSGGEIALVRLLRAVRGDVQAHVILGEDGPLRPLLEGAGATVEVLPMHEALRDVRREQVTPSRLNPLPLVALCRYIWRLRRRIRQLAPDLVHTNSLKAALYGGVAGRLAGVPVVWHVRDRIAPDYLPRSAVVLVRLLSHVVPARIIANSQATLATLPPSPRGAVLFNPVVASRQIDLTLAPPSPRTPDCPLRVGIVGRIAPWKGHDVFFRAFAAAFQRGQAEAWVIGSTIFGEQAYADELRRLADELGITPDVVWRGFRDDIPAELAQLDILVHASTVPEPFGSVIVEGMAAGVPVIAAAAGGPLEIIHHDVDGLLTAPGDVPALTAAMRSLAADPAYRTRLRTAGQATSDRYNPSAARTRLLDLYSTAHAMSS